MADKHKSSWLAPAAVIMSLITCYGTLAAIGLLGALGVTVALNETVWAGAIIFFSWLTVLLLWSRWRRHGATLPIVLAAIGATVLTFTMTIIYARRIEIIGFAFLCAGTYLDWRAGRHKRRTLD